MRSQRPRLGAVLLAVLAMQPIAGPVAAQQQARSPIAVRYVLQPIVGPKEICVGVQEAYTLRLLKELGYSNGAGGIEWQTWGGYPGLIEVDLTNSGRVVTHAHSDGRLAYGITARAAGNITLSAAARSLPNGASAGPVSLDITARDCRFRIQQLSVWFHLAEGFKPWVGGVVAPKEVVIDPPGATITFQQTLETFAIASGVCAPDFLVDDVQATYSLSLPTPDRLHYVVNYTPGTAQAVVQCGPAGGASVPAPFRLEPIRGDIELTPSCFIVCIGSPQTVFTDSVAPHVLHQESDASGVTRTIVERLP